MRAPSINALVPLSFASAIVLDKTEALDACSDLAAAATLLSLGGYAAAASRLEILFELLEDRLGLVEATVACRYAAGCGRGFQ